MINECVKRHVATVDGQDPAEILTLDTLSLTCRGFFLVNFQAAA